MGGCPSFPSFHRVPLFDPRISGRRPCAGGSGVSSRPDGTVSFPSVLQPCTLTFVMASPTKRRRIMAYRCVPLSPVVDWWRERHPPHLSSDCVCSVGGWCGSVESFARRLGVSHSTMYRRQRLGIVDVYEADRWAACLGVHPTRIWPRWDRIDNAEDQLPDPADGWRQVIV